MKSVRNEQSMEHASGQPGKHRGAGRPWLPGQSGNPRGRALWREMVQSRAQELCAEFGGFSNLSAADQGLALRAAELLLRKAPTVEQAVRAGNCADRLINGLRKRHGARQKSEPSSLPDWARKLESAR